MSAPTLTITADNTKAFNEIIKRFKKDAVLVGIPEDDNNRKEADTIGNAALLAINNFGSPINNIPARPVMQIGISKAREDIAQQFRLAARKVWSEGIAILEHYYERAGIIASQSIKRVINDQEGIEPPAASTLKARKYIGKSGFKGTKSLVVTGQMRNAITYVVKNIWGT